MPLTRTFEALYYGARHWLDRDAREKLTVAGATLRAASDTQLPGRGPLVCVVLRNELVRIPFFLSYYRNMGFKHFLAIDNGSSDGSLAELLEQPDVSVWVTNQPYSDSHFGVDWINCLLLKYCLGRWVLTVDVDEFFVYPDMEHRPLDELIGHLEKIGVRSMFAPLIDCYPEGPISAVPYGSGDSPFEACPWFDRTGYERYSSDFGGVNVRGGPRKRAFFNHGDEGPALNKTPLVLWSASTRYLHSTHYLSPPSLNTPEGRWPCPTGALMHFKFLSDFTKKVETETARQQHWNDAIEYKTYSKKLSARHDLTLHDTISERFETSNDLEKHGLITRGSWS